MRHSAQFGPMITESHRTHHKAPALERSRHLRRFPKMGGCCGVPGRRQTACSPHICWIEAKWGETPPNHARSSHLSDLFSRNPRRGSGIHSSALSGHTDLGSGQHHICARPSTRAPSLRPTRGAVGTCKILDGDRFLRHRRLVGDSTLQGGSSSERHHPDPLPLAIR